MSKKSNSVPQSKTLPSKPIQGNSTTVQQKHNDSKKSVWLYIFICLVLTLIAYLPTFQAGFVTWDDPDYVLNNPAIKALGNLKEILMSPVQGNYHPLTMLSLAVNYAISGEDARSYHLVNLVLHLLNVVLVFFFVFRLTHKKLWIAFVAALLFGIHPLHVESVAWVSERKDVLYSFFFLGGLITYLTYLETKATLKLMMVLGFFILSLLSKPAAIIFPLVLLAIDYYQGRSGYLRLLTEKIPFLILSALMAYLTMHGQSVHGAVAPGEIFPLMSRICFAFYGLMMYIVKTIWPADLCLFYPYPPINLPLPSIYFLSIVFGIGLFALGIMAHKKNKMFAFALLFYVINLLLVLQFLPVGSAVMADRYAYLPLIGLFLIPGYFVQKWADSHDGKLPVAGIGLLFVVSLGLTVLSSKQVATWKDNVSLWDKAIAACPSSKAYFNRGLACKVSGDKEGAIVMYTKSISMNKNEFKALDNRGNIYFDLGKNELALNDYRQALAVQKNSQQLLGYKDNKYDSRLLSNLGSLFGKQGNYDSSLYYFNLSISVDSMFKNNYQFRGLTYQMMHRYEDAISDYKHYLRLEPNDDYIMSAIGVNYQRMDKHKESLTWFDQAIAKNPKSGQSYLNRSFSYYTLGDKQKALQDMNMARQLGTTIPADYLSSLSTTK